MTQWPFKATGWCIFAFSQTTGGDSITGYSLVSMPGFEKLSCLEHLAVWFSTWMILPYLKLLVPSSHSSLQVAVWKLFSSLMYKICLSWRICLYNTKSQNMEVFFHFWIYFLEWKDYKHCLIWWKEERIKKGKQRAQKPLQIGEKEMFLLAKPRLNANNKKKMNDTSHNVT